MALFACTFHTPLSPALAVVDTHGALVSLSLLCADDDDVLPRRFHSGENVTWDAARVAPVAARVQRYFDGARTRFDTPLALRGTSFQHQVWAEITRVPFGSAITCKTLARRLGRPHACREVGGACGENPAWIVVPCHRIIGRDTSLAPSAASLRYQQQLLALEKT